MTSRKPVVEECACLTREPNTLAPTLVLNLCQNKNTKKPLETSDRTGSGRRTILTRDIYSVGVIAMRNDNKEQTLLPGDQECLGEFQAAQAEPKSCNCRQLLHDATAVGKGGE